MNFTECAQRLHTPSKITTLFNQCDPTIELSGRALTLLQPRCFTVRANALLGSFILVPYLKCSQCVVGQEIPVNLRGACNDEMLHKRCDGFPLLCAARKNSDIRRSIHDEMPEELCTVPTGLVRRLIER
jgi:hypothetical protein